MAHEVFISYSPSDRPAAFDICAFLESRDIGCWVADRDASPANREGSRQEALAASQALLVVVSSYTMDQTSPQRQEMGEAQARNIPIIFFLVEDLQNLINISMFMKEQITIDAFDITVEEPLEKLSSVLLKALKGYRAFRLLVWQQKLAAILRTIIVYTLIFLKRYFFIFIILGVAVLYYLGFFQAPRDDKPVDGLCPVPPKLIRAVTSSGSPPERAAEFKPEHVLDNRPETAWAPTIQGPKDKGWVQITFVRPLLIAKIGIVNGYGKPGAFQENGRVAKITLKFTDQEVQAGLADKPEVQYLRITPVRTSSVRLVIDSAYPGPAQATPCLSEIQVFAYCDQIS